MRVRSIVAFISIKSFTIGLFATARSGRFPPFSDGEAGYGVPETGHPTRRVEADMTACDPKPPLSGFRNLAFSSAGMFLPHIRDSTSGDQYEGCPIPDPRSRARHT